VSVTAGGAQAKLAPPLYPLLDATVRARVTRYVSELQTLAADARTDDDRRQIFAILDELLEISTALHPRDQLSPSQGPLLRVFVTTDDMAGATTVVQRLGGAVLVHAKTVLVARVPLDSLQALS